MAHLPPHARELESDAPYNHIPSPMLPGGMKAALPRASERHPVRPIMRMYNRRTLAKRRMHRRDRDLDGRPSTGRDDQHARAPKPCRSADPGATQRRLSAAQR